MKNYDDTNDTNDGISAHLQGRVVKKNVIYENPQTIDPDLARALARLKTGQEWLVKEWQRIDRRDLWTEPTPLFWKGFEELIVPLLYVVGDRVKRYQRQYVEGPMSEFARVGEFCPNPECCDYGERQKGNIIKFGKTEAGRQRYRCHSCDGTFTETRGTVKDRRPLITF